LKKIDWQGPVSMNKATLQKDTESHMLKHSLIQMADASASVVARNSLCMGKGLENNQKKEREYQ